MENLFDEILNVIVITAYQVLGVLADVTAYQVLGVLAGVGIFLLVVMILVPPTDEQQTTKFASVILLVLVFLVPVFFYCAVSSKKVLPPGMTDDLPVLEYIFSRNVLDYKPKLVRVREEPRLFQVGLKKDERPRPEVPRRELSAKEEKFRESAEFNITR